MGGFSFRVNGKTNIMHHCGADRKIYTEKYGQILTFTYPIISTFATKCVHLLPVGPILPSAVKIQGAKQNLILQPYDTEIPKKQVYFYFGKQLPVRAVKMQVQGVKEIYSFVLPKFPCLLKQTSTHK